MIAILVACGLALLLTFVGTPQFIKVLEKRGYGQFIRDDGPTSHATKRGTPTMGGVVIIIATVLAYFGGHLLTGSTPEVSGLLVLWLTAGLGMVGFLDDFIKVKKQRSLGLRAYQKIIGQGFVGITFAVAALQFPDEDGLTPASTAVSFVRELPIDFAIAGGVVGLILFVIWANLIITAASNAVNLTDGLDGLATGSSVMVLGGYVLITAWQHTQGCDMSRAVVDACYTVRDPRDLAMVAAAMAGAAFGFLWWNTSPAKIFMGDTGSLAFGGAIAGIAILSHTQLLLIIMCGLFVIITMSVLIQVAAFKSTGKRVFRMAPLQHHFELRGWAEVTIVVRFWIIAGCFAVIGTATFYGEWVSRL